jgi:Flp pilus assembly protein TadB
MPKTKQHNNKKVSFAEDATTPLRDSREDKNKKNNKVKVKQTMTSSFSSSPSLSEVSEDVTPPRSNRSRRQRRSQQQEEEQSSSGTMMMCGDGIAIPVITTATAMVVMGTVAACGAIPVSAVCGTLDSVYDDNDEEEGDARTSMSAASRDDGPSPRLQEALRKRQRRMMAMASVDRNSGSDNDLHKGGSPGCCACLRKRRRLLTCLIVVVVLLVVVVGAGLVVLFVTPFGNEFRQRTGLFVSSRSHSSSSNAVVGSNISNSTSAQSLQDKLHDIIDASPNNNPDQNANADADAGGSSNITDALQNADDVTNGDSGSSTEQSLFHNNGKKAKHTQTVYIQYA